MLKFNNTILALLFFLIALLACQSNKIKDKKNTFVHVKDFGAIPNDGINDTRAIRAAIHELKNGDSFLFDDGEYLVGVETFSGFSDGCAYCSEPVINLEGLENITIEGKGAILKFDEGFHIGTFNPGTGKPYKGKASTDPNLMGMGGGMGIEIRNCNNITIRNLIIDGNNDGKVVGGYWAGFTYETGNHGIAIYNSKNINLSFIDIQNCGMDGIYISNSTPNRFATPSQNINIENINSFRNARQGLSWVGGVGLTVVNSKFNQTGRGNFASAPSAGLDIEPNYPNITYKGRFINCEFVDNKGIGFVTENSTSVSDNLFQNCTFWGTTYYSAWPNAPKTIFEDCFFYGECVNPFNAVKTDDRTQFIRCHFEDKPYPPVNQVYGSYVLNCDRKRKVLYDSCTIVANRVRAIYTKGLENWTDNDRIVFNKCEILLCADNLPEKDSPIIFENVLLKDINIKDKFSKSHASPIILL